MSNLPFWKYTQLPVSFPMQLILSVLSHDHHFLEKLNLSLLHTFIDRPMSDLFFVEFTIYNFVLDNVLWRLKYFLWPFSCSFRYHLQRLSLLSPSDYDEASNLASPFQLGLHLRKWELYSWVNWVLVCVTTQLFLIVEMGQMMI